jgi:hypothetical protein
MQSPGSNISRNFLTKLPILVTLCGILLLIYTRLNAATSNISGTIYDLIKKNGFNEPLAGFVLAQSAHETAIAGIPFQSSLLKQNNNLFGMKYNGQLYAMGEKNGFAYYDNLEYSIADFASWWQRHRSGFINMLLPVDSLERYVSILKDNDYFEASEQSYLAGVSHFYNKLFK